MKLKLNRGERKTTSYVQLDTQKCKACWQCISECHNQVIGKIDLPWHKHALITNADKCCGCLKCIKTCPYQAFSNYDDANQTTEKRRKRNFYHFIINNLLLFSGMVMILSGLNLQLGFHLGGPEHGLQNTVHIVTPRPIEYEQFRKIDTHKMVCGFTYPQWSIMHKYAIAFFSLLMIYHLYAHWQWYKGMIQKRLFRKNIQVVALSVLFSGVAVTGMIPWLIDLTGSTSILRLRLIEIHDKLALMLLVYLILHFTKRYRWFFTTFSKIKG